MPLTTCWGFFADPRNLEKITPPSLRFRLKADLPPKVYPGLMIEYTVSPILGIPITWLTEIVHVDKPHHFVDEQQIGPYQLWHHEHFFRELTDGRVEVCDRIHYAPPFGPVGAIANSLVIRGRLARRSLCKCRTLRTSDSFA